MKKYVCEICNEEFDNWQQKANHIRWKHKKIKYSEDNWVIKMFSETLKEESKLPVYNLYGKIMKNVKLSDNE